MSTDAAIATTARAWVAAEQERRVRQRERKLAWMMAFKAGVTSELTGDGYHEEPRSELVASTPEQEVALALARCAYEAHIAAASRARALRAALTRMTRPAKPEPNPEVAAAYAVLSAAEEAAFKQQLESAA